MTLHDFLSVCKDYNNLGWAIQEQLHAVVEDEESVHDQNSEAMRRVISFLKQAAELDVEDAGEWAETIKSKLAKPQVHADEE